MSKLVYVWYHEYSGYVHDVGISLSKAYIINTTIISEDASNNDDIKVHVDVKKNLDYLCPPDFYGKNIDGMTAIVGENGSGKTTIARMLVDYPFSTLNKKSPFFWVEASDEGDILIYNYETQIEFESDKRIKIKKWQENEWSSVYMSNMFNFSELAGDIGLNELEVGANAGLIRQIYSPASLMKYAKEKAIKKQYGYMAHFPRTEYLSMVQAYARSMENSEIQAYIKLQEQLMIEGYYNTSEEIRTTLDIFQQYEIELIGFATNDMENVETEEEKNISKVRKYYLQYRNKTAPDDFWHNIYNVCVAEMCLALRKLSDNEVEKFYMKYSQLNLDSIDALDNYCDNPLFRGIDWIKQIKECLTKLKEYYDEGKYEDWKLGKQRFEDSKEMIDWYYNELKKPTSFFKRNLRFRLHPNSTGELALLNLFSYITDAMLKNPMERNFLLIIDEIDAALHPRWQQKIIKFLRDYLESFQEYRFQVIITSHSPIILSDILKEHAVKVKKSAKGFMQLEEMSEPTFGANIAMQFLDSFYMDEGNIGDFAKEKIKKLIEDIDKLEGGNIEEERKLRYLIDSIGELMVRKKLHQDINRKNPEYVSFIEQWEKCSDEVHRNILDYMEQQNHTKE